MFTGALGQSTALSISVVITSNLSWEGDFEAHGVVKNSSTRPRCPMKNRKVALRVLRRNTQILKHGIVLFYVAHT
jgi:hypothetical protein